MKLNMLKKYNVPCPRYTSYPTVPMWDPKGITDEEWRQEIKISYQRNTDKGISLYIHLPYCESLCTYCGCNKRITKNHQVESPYIETVLKEWQMYLKILGKRPLLAQLHLGGGTPTFFSAENLGLLVNTILGSVDLVDDPELSVEVHPEFTKPEQLRVLRDAGFSRISVGIQDFDPKVQYIINRFQSYAKTKEVIDCARKLGYTSINVDLVYGLPLQTMSSVVGTVEKIKELRPDRIAFYSYAHVPWKSKGQRRFTEDDLPDPETKMKLYLTGTDLLKGQGYVEIGMDHFCLPNDNMYEHLKQGTLFRNFMGYTIQETGLLIGLGASSISDTSTAFMQNEKEIESYTARINAGQLPITIGHILTTEDLLIRHYITGVMCKLKTEWHAAVNLYIEDFPEIIERLKDLEKDGLIRMDNKKLEVTPQGKMFLRNICLCFDLRFWRNQATKQMFSNSV